MSPGRTPVLAVALDLPDLSAALEMARRLEGLDCWFKVGLELYTAEGPRAVTAFKDMGRKVFLDLKFHDIPNTVRGAVRSAARLGADMLTLHLSGGQAMAEAAVWGREEATSDQPPLLVGVTVLTSQDAPSGADPTANPVLDLARRAKAWYLDGVVCSGLEVAGVRSDLGEGFLCVTPGIRPTIGGEQAAANDQKRVVTPAEAVRSGADFLVVGRPITAAADPAEAASDVLQQMAQANLGRE